MLCFSKREVTERVAKSPAQSDSRPSRPLSGASACPASPPCCAVLRQNSLASAGCRYGACPRLYGPEARPDRNGRSLRFEGARYDKPGAVPSEHAKGKAVDIVAFLLADGRRI